MEYGSQPYFNQGVNDLGPLYTSSINYWVRGIILHHFWPGKHVDKAQANRSDAGN